MLSGDVFLHDFESDERMDLDINQADIDAIFEYFS